MLMCYIVIYAPFTASKFTDNFVMQYFCVRKRVWKDLRYIDLNGQTFYDNIE